MSTPETSTSPLLGRRTTMRWLRPVTMRCAWRRSPRSGMRGANRPSIPVPTRGAIVAQQLPPPGSCMLDPSAPGWRRQSQNGMERCGRPRPLLGDQRRFIRWSCGGGHDEVAAARPPCSGRRPRRPWPRSLHWPGDGVLPSSICPRDRPDVSSPGSFSIRPPVRAPLDESVLVDPGIVLRGLLESADIRALRRLDRSRSGRSVSMHVAPPEAGGSRVRPPARAADSRAVVISPTTSWSGP